MKPSKNTYDLGPDPVSSLREQHIEEGFIEKLVRLKYSHRQDIRTKASLEKNFREKFQRLNAVNLSDSEFERLLLQITTADVFKASQTLRRVNDFERDGPRKFFL